MPVPYLGCSNLDEDAQFNADPPTATETNLRYDPTAADNPAMGSPGQHNQWAYFVRPAPTVRTIVVDSDPGAQTTTGMMDTTIFVRVHLGKEADVVCQNDVGEVNGVDMYWSKLTFTAAANTAYYVIVGGQNADEHGMYYININGL